jgi:hypothetical protein
VKKPKLMVIGLDAVSLTLLDSFRQACPNIRKLMARGVTGRAMPCLPVYTPTNWAALSTGAEAAVTHAAGWQNSSAGRPLSTFDRRAIPCDNIFDAAARAALRTLAISYPSAHPSKGAGNIVLVPLDRGLVSNCLAPGRIVDAGFDSAGCFAFDLLDKPASLTGAAMAKAVGATEDGAAAGGKRTVAAAKVRAYVFEAGARRWRLGFAPDAGRAKIALGHEKWSEPIRVDIAAAGRCGKCVVRVMMFDGGKRLAVSGAYDIAALGKPASLARDVYRKFGPPTEHSVFYAGMSATHSRGARDATVSRLAYRDLKDQADWIVRAARHVQKTRPFDIFYLHHHLPDSVLHTYLAAANGSPAYSPRQRATARAVIRECIGICDGLVGGLLKLAGPGTSVLLVSEHGNVPNRYATNVQQRLIETGLAVPNGDGSVSRKKSAALPGSVWTWIKVNARRGTRKYEEIQRRVIDALLDWKTPDGERVIAVALKRKDSHLLGYYGRHCGDVTFHYNSGFAWFGKAALAPVNVGANHGPQMPVTFSKISDNLAFFVLAGPAFKRGLRQDEESYGYIRLTDLLPTVCQAGGLPMPRDATGAVRYGLLR